MPVWGTESLTAGSCPHDSTTSQRSSGWPHMRGRIQHLSGQNQTTSPPLRLTESQPHKGLKLPWPLSTIARSQVSSLHQLPILSSPDSQSLPHSRDEQSRTTRKLLFKF